MQVKELTRLVLVTHFALFISSYYCIGNTLLFSSRLL